MANDFWYSRYQVMSFVIMAIMLPYFWIKCTYCHSQKVYDNVCCIESFLCSDFCYNNFWIFLDESSLSNIIQYIHIYTWLFDDINYKNGY